MAEWLQEVRGRRRRRKRKAETDFPSIVTVQLLLPVHSLITMVHIQHAIDRLNSGERRMKRENERVRFETLNLKQRREELTSAT